MINDSEICNVNKAIITNDLDRRPSRVADYKAENLALTLLAEAMSNSPSTVLQQLVKAAMELTDSDSAGLSLLDPGGEQNTFSWVATAGAWPPYRDGTMSRDLSLCGKAVNLETVLLLNEPEQTFSTLLQGQPGLGEALLAPFKVEGTTIGTLWAVKHTPDGRFQSEDARLLKSLTRFGSAAYQATEAKQVAEELRDLESSARITADARLTAELADAKMLQELSGRLIGEYELQTLYEQVVEVAMKLMNSQAASMQVFDPGKKQLQLVAFRNFHPVSAAFWQSVDSASASACGTALHDLRRCIIDDAEGSPLLAQTQDLEEYRRSNLRSCQSTPLVTRGGRLIGMISTHWRDQHEFADAEFALFDVLARQAADLIERMNAEAALRESNERFRNFSNASTHALWIRDAQTLEMTFASPAFDKIYGISGPEGFGDGRLRSWARVIEPKKRKTVLSNFRRVRGGERVEQEFQIRRASDGVLRWIHDTGFPLRDANGHVRHIAGLYADMTDVKEATDRQDVLVAELQHRTRNLIAVVRTLADQTLSNAVSFEDFGKRFGLRLAALSRVQGILSDLAAGERVTFDELLRAELAAHDASNGLTHKFTLEGPANITLRSGTVQIIALALHELVINALEFGALAAADGHLFVKWHIEPPEGNESPGLHVRWRESGVSMPEVSSSVPRRGHGRALIELALPYQLNAKTTYELGSDGVCCTIIIPISHESGNGYLNGY